MKSGAQHSDEDDRHDDDNDGNGDNSNDNQNGKEQTATCRNARTVLVIKKRILMNECT